MILTEKFLRLSFYKLCDRRWFEIAKRRSAFDFLGGIFKRKASTTTSVLLAGSNPKWMSNGDFCAQAEEGYKGNPHVFTCVSKIAKAVAGIPWLVYRDSTRKKEEDECDLKTLIQRPNPEEGQAAFFEHFMSDLKLGGNAYIYYIATGKHRELWVLRPDRMRVLPGTASYRVGGYEYSIGSQKTILKPEDILHLKLYDPLSDWYGMSPIDAMARSIDQNNMGRKWSAKIMHNQGKPPGIISVSANVNDVEIERLRAMVDERYEMSRGNNRPLLLANATWQDISSPAADAQWDKAMTFSKREISEVYGVPSELIGDSENKTYSNYKEARKAFYEETILPDMDNLRDALNNWLSPKVDNHYLDYDRDQIEALKDDIDALWTRANNTFGLTVDEKRAMLGYEALGPEKGGDIVIMPSNSTTLDMVSMYGMGSDGDDY